VFVGVLLVGSLDAQGPRRRVSSRVGERPLISAGVDRSFALPATDLSLFGSATTPGANQSYAWSQVSGPAAATIDAPWALTTNVTFSTAGTYTFRLEAYDGVRGGADEMTVVVGTAASQTAFYVDPTYSGGGSDGSAAAPWLNLHKTSGGSTEWNAINAALASGHVIVYFSARIVGSDTSETTAQSVDLWRTDTSTNRLTLDGMSKYNTNDTSGSWTDYGGSSDCSARKCFKFAITSDGYSVGVTGLNPNYPGNYTTVRGFEVTSNGASARVRANGNYSVWEHLWVHDITTDGATVQFTQPMNEVTCAVTFGYQHHFTISRNLIEDGYGEGIYVPGNYFKTAQGGCLANGQAENNHYDMLLEDNIIRNPGANGGQGDGIDLKAGLLRITLRNNEITGMPTATQGIVISGIFPNQDLTYADRAGHLIEGNYIHDNLGRCISLANINYSAVRNNVCANNSGGVGIGLITPVPEAWPYTIVDQVQILNNTCVNTQLCWSTADATNVVLRNNLIAELASGTQLGKSSSAVQPDSDYNIIVTSRAQAGGWKEGAHTLSFANLTAFFTDLGGGDFTLASGVGALDVGVDLSGYQFNVDRAGVTRPQGAAWDIGAYERE
jgi:hypothetical protein